jgi:hypothetical protein
MNPIDALEVAAQALRNAAAVVERALQQERGALKATKRKPTIKQRANEIKGEILSHRNLKLKKQNGKFNRNCTQREV